VHRQNIPEEERWEDVSVDNSWFAVWTRSRHEHFVRDQLAIKGIEVYLPTVSRWSRWRDRKKRIDWPLFPGYCFARYVPDHRLRVLNCFGVVNIVSFSGEPAPIPDEEIGAIRLLVASGLEYESCPSLQEGTVVEVTHGPLAGVVGRFVRKGANTRLVLSVDTISVAVSVEVDAADVRPFPRGSMH
jgi:transcription termination/antitermination protein NusG